MLKNRIFNLEVLMQQQQRGSFGKTPGPQAHPAGPYQYGPGWLMQGPQPYGYPVYGHSTGLGLGSVRGGMGYAPFHQGYMPPGLQQLPYYPHIRVHQPMNGMNPVLPQGYPSGMLPSISLEQMRTFQRINPIGNQNVNQTYVGLTRNLPTRIQGTAQVSYHGQPSQTVMENRRNMPSNSDVKRRIKRMK